MGFAWHQTSIPGIRYREHPTRRNGVRKDRCYGLRVQFKDKPRIEETIGWESQGWSLEKSTAKLNELRVAHTTGEGPTSLAEKRELADQGRQLKAAELREQERQLVTLAAYFEEHYTPSAKLGKKPDSWRKEAEHYKNWIGPAFGKLPLAQIGIRQFDHLVKTLAAAGRSQRSVEYVCGTLRRILGHAKLRKIPVSIPMAKEIGASAPRDNRRLRIISPTEAEALLGALEGRDPCAFRLTKFAFLTGARLSECFNLTWADVDLEAGTVRLVDTKNKDARMLPMSTPLRSFLEALIPGDADAPVFPNSVGRRYTGVPINFVRAVADLGFNKGRDKRDRISFHSIRHTVATNLAKHLDIRGLMDIMGWRVVNMAARYIHSDEGSKKAAMANLEHAMKPGKRRVVPFTKSGQQG